VTMSHLFPPIRRLSVRSSQGTEGNRKL
jgi:hypothetical protein